MSQLPQIRRLLVEDFMEQKDWISKLFTPLNSFMEGTIGVLTKGVSLVDNCTADLQTITISTVPTVAVPIQLPWKPSIPPKSIHVGNVQLTTFDDFTIAAAVGVQWKWDSKNGLRLVNLFGITPTNATQYLLTLVIFAG